MDQARRTSAKMSSDCVFRRPTTSFVLAVVILLHDFHAFFPSSAMCSPEVAVHEPALSLPALRPDSFATSSTLRLVQIVQICGQCSSPAVARRRRLGFTNHLQLGREIRRRYDGGGAAATINFTYNVNRARARSTDQEDCTLQSAYCMLAGLYPPPGGRTGHVDTLASGSRADEVVNAWAELNWDPVPVHSFSLDAKEMQVQIEGNKSGSVSERLAWFKSSTLLSEVVSNMRGKIQCLDAEACSRVFYLYTTDSTVALSFTQQLQSKLVHLVIPTDRVGALIVELHQSSSDNWVQFLYQGDSVASTVIYLTSCSLNQLVDGNKHVGMTLQPQPLVYNDGQAASSHKNRVAIAAASTVLFFVIISALVITCNQLNCRRRITYVEIKSIE